MRTCVFCMYVHFMNHMYAYLRDDRKIKFRMVSAQHFINEALGVSSAMHTSGPMDIKHFLHSH